MKKNQRIIFIFLVSLLSGALGLFFSLLSHKKMDNQSLAIEEMKTVRVSHSPVTFVKQLTDDAEAGRKIFKEFCASCHDKKPLIDIQAPRIGDKKQWKMLRKIGMPALLKMTTQGVGAMPARGGCFECSDDQLRETIQYILQQSAVTAR